MTRISIIILTFFTAVVLLSGCLSPQERRGINPKPFNSPASWENRPFGDLRN